MTIILGQVYGRSQTFNLQLSDAARLQHMLILGQTGTGKSTLIEAMARQDIENGKPFCLIDPHGDLSTSLANFANDRVIHWKVGDPSTSLGHNPLSTDGTMDKYLKVSGLIDALRKQWSEAWGPRMEHLLRYALLALIETENPTLLEILPLFLDKTRRAAALSCVKDTQVLSFWHEEFPAMNYRTSIDGVAPIANKLGALLAHPLVRKGLCNPESPINFDHILKNKQSIVIDLSVNTVGPDVSNIVGGLVLSSLMQSGLKRGALNPINRTMFTLYIDECHNFTTLAFVEMLSTLRKFGLAIIASTQYTSRMVADVRDGFMGNIGNLISFRVGASDCETISKQFGSTVPSSRDLLNLSNFEAYAKFMHQGIRTPVCSLRTLPLTNQPLSHTG